MIEAVRRLRNYRDSVGAPPSALIPARLVAIPTRVFPEAIGRLARFDIVARGSDDGRDGEVVSSIGLEGATVEVLPSDTVDPAEARARIDAERRAAARRDAIARAASSRTRASPTRRPPQLVQAEREKLERFEAELAELED